MKSLDIVIYKLLNSFVKSKERSKWIENKIFNLYIRNTNRFLDDGATHSSLDIANITVHKQGNGVFTTLLRVAEKICKEHKIEVIFVESILEPRLFKFLEEKGYIYSTTSPNSMYKRV